MLRDASSIIFVTVIVLKSSLSRDPRTYAVVDVSNERFNRFNRRMSGD